MLLGSVLWAEVRYVQKRKSEDSSNLLGTAKAWKSSIWVLLFSIYSYIKICLDGIYSEEPEAVMMNKDQLVPYPSDP